MECMKREEKERIEKKIGRELNGVEAQRSPTHFGEAQETGCAEETLWAC